MRYTLRVEEEEEEQEQDVQTLLAVLSSFPRRHLATANRKSRLLARGETKGKEVSTLALRSFLTEHVLSRPL